MGLNSGIDPEIPGTQTAIPDQQFLQQWSPCCWEVFQVETISGSTDECMTDLSDVNFASFPELIMAQMLRIRGFPS